MKHWRTRLAHDEPPYVRLMAGRTSAMHDLLAKEDDRKAPEWIHLFPYGSWEGHASGPVEINEAILTVMVANFDRSEIDVVIDYEHSTESWPPDPEGAIAAGFVDKVEIRDDGLWGRTRYWTDKATDRIESGEYRYLSPAWTMNYIDPASGADLGPKLLSVGMVNRPFFQELTPLAAKDKERIPMDEKTLKALGLAKDATPEQIAAAIKANADKLAETEQAKKDAETALAEAQKTLDELNANKDEPEPEALTDAVRSEFDLPEGATTIDLKAAKLKLSMGSPDLAKDVAEIKARLANEETAVLVAKYVKEGKITKGMLADATALAKASPELFVKTFDNAPALNLATEVVNGAAPVTDPEKYELTSDDKFVAKQLGLTDEEFSKSAVTLNARLTE